MPGQGWCKSQRVNAVVLLEDDVASRIRDTIAELRRQGVPFIDYNPLVTEGVYITTGRELLNRSVLYG
jgi:hypothetical protein